MPNKKLLSAILLFSITLFACTSVSGIFGSPDPNDPGLSAKELEDDSISADMTAFAGNHPSETPEPPSQPTPPPVEVEPENTLDLSPEEAANEGRHHYSVEGSGQPLLGGEGTYSGEKPATHEFYEGKVIFSLNQNPPAEYLLTAENTYTSITSDQFIVYTPTGFELHMPTVEWIYVYTLDE